MKTCEFLCHPNTTIADPLLLPFTRRSLNEASLLGAPLFIGPELDDAWLMKLVDLRIAVEPLCLLSAQAALVLNF